jgi:hypothetical protein
MKLPTQAKPVARLQSQAKTVRGVQPSGCCAQVCVPFVGCHCVLEAPICP